MFFFCSQPLPRTKPLNAIQPQAAPIESAAERTARHIAILQRMTDLGLQLLERVAADGLQTPETQAKPQPAKQADHIVTYGRICRCVRDTMAHEARIAAGIRPATPAEKTATIPSEHRKSTNDPRHPVIKNFLVELIENSPHPKSVKAGFRQQLDPLITEGLESDPEQDHPAGAIVLAVCEELGLECSPSQMPDELLTRLHRQITPAEKAAVAAVVYRRIHGHDPP